MPSNRLSFSGILEIFSEFPRDIVITAFFTFVGVYLATNQQAGASLLTDFGATRDRSIVNSERLKGVDELDESLSGLEARIDEIEEISISSLTSTLNDIQNSLERIESQTKKIEIFVPGSETLSDKIISQVEAGYEAAYLTNCSREAWLGRQRIELFEGSYDLDQHPTLRAHVRILSDEQQGTETAFYYFSEKCGYVFVYDYSMNLASAGRESKIRGAEILTTEDSKILVYPHLYGEFSILIDK